MDRAVVALVVAAVASACSLLPGSDPTWPPTPVPSGSNATSAPATPSPASSSSPVATQVPTATLNNLDIERIRLDVIGAVNTDPGNFGGVYRDESGALVILYVGANAGRARVEALLQPGVAVRWQKVERSQAALMLILHEISGRNLDGVVAIGLDTINNRVEVVVYPSERLLDVSRALADSYGDAVTVVTGPPAIVH